MNGKLLTMKTPFTTELYYKLKQHYFGYDNLDTSEEKNKWYPNFNRNIGCCGYYYIVADTYVCNVAPNGSQIATFHVANGSTDADLLYLINHMQDGLELVPAGPHKPNFLIGYTVVRIHFLLQ